MHADTHARILSALITYSTAQARKGGHNPHALSHYCAALTDAAKLVADGASVRAALLRCFNGRILDVALRAAGEKRHTADERMSQAYTR
jgi:hypothetical protein